MFCDVFSRFYWFNRTYCLKSDISATACLHCVALYSLGIALYVTYHTITLHYITYKHIKDGFAYTIVATSITDAASLYRSVL